MSDGNGSLEWIKRFLLSQTEGEVPRLAGRQEDNRHLLGSGPTRESPVLPVARPRLCFAFDATASRSEAWEAAKQLTDVLFQALPGQLDVALAIHAGGRLRCFSRYVTDAAKLRDQAARIKCQAGETRLLDILDRVTWETPKAKTVLYIGDCFEECDRKARRLADKLNAQGTRVIILQENHDPTASDVFQSIAARSGGACLPFDLASLLKLRELLGAVAVLAVGGEKLLQEKRGALPGALLLLDGMKTAARLEGRKKK